MTLCPLIKKVKKIVINRIYSLAKIRNSINTKCAFTLYKQTILPLLHYTGFMLLSADVSDKNDLQVLQKNALRIRYNVRLRDRMSIECMHIQAKSLSLDQRRQKQILFVLFIFKTRHDANVYSFVSERYLNAKYKNSPHYKGYLL